MAGLYIHIPFCKTRCIYCDFFSSTFMEEKDRYIDALCREIRSRKDYLKGETIRTIYFGGGTPSQLSAKDFLKIFTEIENTFASTNLPNLHQITDTTNFYTEVEEITLEANPDDITPEYLESIKDLPFNRISIGIQSFKDEELSFLNRRHNAKSAIQAVKDCQSYGLGNISIDLMYGLPGQTMEIWRKNLDQAIKLNVQHISAYHLIIEEGTRLHRLLNQGKIAPVEEELSVQMFGEMIDTLNSAGFEHYEISNFGKPDYHSIHNSSYWNGTHYLGIGASAHSFNGESRQWNASSLQSYYDFELQSHEIEIITSRTAYNDYILTRLRTSKGIDLQELKKLFGEEMQCYCIKQLQKHVENKFLELNENRLKLTRKGLFVSDNIMSDLMIV